MFTNYCDFEDAKADFILSLANEFEDRFEYGGLNLRAAFVRYMYFKLGEDQKGLEQQILSQKTPQEKMLSLQRMDLRLRSRLRMIPGARYLKNELEWLPQQRGKISVGRPLLAVHHWKFVNYLKRSRVFDGLQPAWLVNSRSMITELGLDKRDVFVPLRIGCRLGKEQFPFNELHEMARDLEATIHTAQPSAIFTVEGDAPYHALLAEIGRKHKIPVYCFQWGIFYRNKLRTAFSGMRFTRFLIWGEIFEGQLKEFNPGLEYTRLGHVFFSDEKRVGEKIIFLSQGQGEHIEREDCDSYMELAVSLASRFPNRVTWRPHPSNPLQSAELEYLRNGKVHVLDSRLSLEDQLKDSVAAVGISSSSLIDALAVGVIPITFNTTCLKYFPFPLIEKDIGLECRDFDAALRDISLLLKDSNQIERFQNNIRKNRTLFFGNSDLNSRQEQVRLLCSRKGY